ncbi:phage portal protein [Anaerosalibacter massiliensis]|uniref:Phage portal protein n=1 Tax=Anaerosalibacter massiliensis TaxID=1347392 RepID=A0A9X2MKX8_9FIRM|nr:phage portal protein [Anaerosalibacter massiliensis]MCR2045499.1 phage portal protein [Anaerosalibacter massiliensis]
MFILESDTEMTEELLLELINKHKSSHERYNRLKKMYKGDHPILHQKKKEEYKPDNRLVVNYAKYIVDTLNGFFIGIPIKVSHESDEINNYLDFVDKFNDQDDNNAELSKLCSIYGHAYEMVFIDGDGMLGITYIEPQEAFVVYDNSIVGKPMFGVRYYNNADKKLEGSFSDKHQIIYFRENDEGKLYFYDEKPHLFGDIPIIEYVENEEKIGAFEGVETLINAYNKGLSEKANDVDYFADAYLKILGAELDDKTIKKLRDSRTINMAGGDIDKLIVEFLEKPNADETQENLINRLEKLIFQISMVMNINDETFGTQSGIALKYKLQSMENLAKTKERKFASGLNRRYKMIANTSITPIKGDEWTGIKYQFTRNYPANILEESQIAKNLIGVTSKETALSVLSIVDNAKDEVDRINDEYDIDNEYDFDRNRVDLDE